MSLAPIKAQRNSQWWDDNSATKDHAKHCLPLSMANSLGYYILSPGTFLAKWNGDTHSRAEIEHIEESSHYKVTNHAAFGSFTISAQFIPVTEKPGQFVIIKGIPNQRALPYSCMEAAIEAWWNVGHFGLVFLLNQPGEFIITKGSPIAQMFIYDAKMGNCNAEFVNGYPKGFDHWLERRSRKSYTKDLDYLKGYDSHGLKIEQHIKSWKEADIFD